jgi:drug/metabolite transporter (DMT)-like permease
VLERASPLIPVLLMCIGSSLIGFSAVFVRLSDLGPLTTGFYRMLFALPLLVVWMRWEKKEKTSQPMIFPNDIVGLLVAGVFFSLDLALWNWSVDYTTIVNSTLLNNTAAFYVPLVMWLLFKEQQSVRVLAAATIGFIGCSLLVGESFSISLQSLLGDIVALLSGLMVACYLISLKQIRDRFLTGFLMFWTGACAAVFLAFFAYIFGESFWPLTVLDFVSILGQAVLVHALGQGLIAYSLGKIPATYAAIILFLAPVTAAVLGWIIYAESLSMLKVVGMVLVMASIMAARQQKIEEE